MSEKTPKTVETLTSVFLLCVHRNVAAVSPLQKLSRGKMSAVKFSTFMLLGPGSSTQRYNLVCVLKKSMNNSHSWTMGN